MGCDCIDKVNSMLKDRNTRLSQAMMFGASRNPGLMLQTEQIEKGRGKQKAATMFPSFCPFCGESYKADASAAPSSSGLSRGSAALTPAETSADPRHEAEDDGGASSHGAAT